MTIEMKEILISKAVTFARNSLGGDSSGHDWWHAYRVANLAKKIAQIEFADEYICVLSALLHDIADEKLNESKEKGLAKVEQWMTENLVESSCSNHVMNIISTMSYRGGNNVPIQTLEGRIVQDADRLDALGAIGIARTFAYAGWKGNILFDPDNSPDTAIQHFYDKLLKLKDLMNTEFARTLAEERHQFMELYLKQFYGEWNYN